MPEDVPAASRNTLQHQARMRVWARADRAERGLTPTRHPSHRPRNLQPGGPEGKIPRLGPSRSPHPALLDARITPRAHDPP
eukprot:908572-Pyramimonas_sp.AAC.1